MKDGHDPGFPDENDLLINSELIPVILSGKKMSKKHI